jgi:HD-GYP domain-containing protein (c-di-GMP phosphodiesterase class II)
VRHDRIEAGPLDPCDSRHSARVASLAERFAIWLGWDDGRRSAIRLGSVLHDVGKLTVSRAVLRKPGQLTDAELEEVRHHPSAGAWLVAPVRSLSPALPCILLHHERWDGDGYPTGRRATNVPVEARLLAVVDAFDAMTSDRPYRRALGIDHALDELERGAGSQFDPALAEAFVSAWKAGAFDRAAATGLTRLRASTAFA